MHLMTVLKLYQILSPAIYDLPYFDIKMPQLNGFDLYDKIKKEKNNNQTLDLLYCYI